MAGFSVCSFMPSRGETYTDGQQRAGGWELGCDTVLCFCVFFVLFAVLGLEPQATLPDFFVLRLLLSSPNLHCSHLAL